MGKRIPTRQHVCLARCVRCIHPQQVYHARLCGFTIDMEAPLPSKVVHIRNLQESTTEADVMSFCSMFGAIDRVVNMKTSKQALVQMRELSAAANLVAYYATAAPVPRIFALWTPPSPFPCVLSPLLNSASRLLMHRQWQ